MVSYSFQGCFIAPIQVGLGIWDGAGTPPRPKRQTIRAIGKRRHARPGEELQLYHKMRQPGCFLIGRAHCIGIAGIRIHPGLGLIAFSDSKPISRAKDLDKFARCDGFDDFAGMREFWRVHHPDVTDFSGYLIRWEPKKEAPP